MENGKSLYANLGVDYSVLDRIKLLAQKEARTTSGYLERFGAEEVAQSRGESAFVWKEDNTYRALVIEGLGTKNIVADAVRKITGKTYYQAIAKDTVAMIVNDLIVVGADPMVLVAYYGVGDSSWMADEERATDLIKGWANACHEIKMTWGGGETPALKGVIDPNRIDLAGAAIGRIKEGNKPILGEDLVAGDRIVVIESSDIHANGITGARDTSQKMPDGYSTLLPDGRMFGEALLTPTHIYTNLVHDLIEKGVDIHYMANITGHGWRKIMRADKEFTYIIEQIPPSHQSLDLIQKTSGVSDKEMYETFNMGAGFAVFMPEEYVDQAQEIATQNGFSSLNAGRVEEGPRRVVIEPKGIVFEGESLQIR